MTLARYRKQLLLTAIAITLTGGVLVHKYLPAYHRTELVFPQPPYQPASTCPAILLQYDDAISARGLESGRSASDLSSLNDRFIGGRAPHCPDGGKITLGTKALATTCGIHGIASDDRPIPGPRKLSFKERFSWENLEANWNIAGRNACIANLKQMDGATQQWALDNKKTDADVVDGMASAQYLKGADVPLCPGGGKYRFSNVVSNAPVCTKAHSLGHSLP
jgi:hypothetical protein